MRTGEQTTTKTTIDYFSRQFSPEDQSIPYRLVGSWEYAKSLDNLNRLINISTEDEISEYDVFLESRPEFTYYQGVSTAFREPPDLTKANPKQRSRFNDRFQKGGLAWMMALAQIELAATVSMYSDMEKPFSGVVTTKFGHEEYSELLIDDLVSHLKALASEPLFKEVLKLERQVDTWTLAYLRRLKVVKDLMITISDFADVDTVAEMRPWFDELEEHEESLVSIVNIWLTGATTSESESETRSVVGGDLLGEVSRFGKTTSLSPALIRECKRRIGQTVIRDPDSNRVRTDPAESRHDR